MSRYPYRCRECQVGLELEFRVGEAPSVLACPYCGGSMGQDYVAKRVLITPLKEAEREENRLTEEDRPTAEALAALHAFASMPTGTVSEGGGGLASFSIGGEG